MYEFDGINFESVPLKIVTTKKEYVDDAKLDVEKMVNEIKETKGKSSDLTVNFAACENFSLNIINTS